LGHLQFKGLIYYESKGGGICVNLVDALRAISAINPSKMGNAVDAEKKPRNVSVKNKFS
jgi:hypothetical protein